MTNEQFDLETKFSFHPQYGTEEDENGMVTATASFRQVVFGTGEPKVLVEIGEADDDDAAAKMTMTVGDLDLEETRDFLKLAYLAAEEAYRQSQN